MLQASAHSHLTVHGWQGLQHLPLCPSDGKVYLVRNKWVAAPPMLAALHLFLRLAVCLKACAVGPTAMVPIEVCGVLLCLQIMLLPRRPSCPCCWPAAPPCWFSCQSSSRRPSWTRLHRLAQAKPACTSLLPQPAPWHSASSALRPSLKKRRTPTWLQPPGASCRPVSA